jgi:hypothetical protein
MNYAKPLLQTVAASSAGMYLGGRYVGGLAKATYTTSKPAWIQTAQSTLWMSLALCALCVIGWIVLDYREVNDG